MPCAMLWMGKAGLVRSCAENHDQSATEDADRMKAKLPWLIALSLISAPALAAERLVLGDGVNLRAGPGQDKPVLAQLQRDDRVRELAVEGDWVRIESLKPAGRAGWIHRSLLSPAAFAEFRKHFDYRNARAKELTGETFFHRVEDRGEGLIRVVASDVWLAQPEVGRLDNLRFILSIWSQAQPKEAAGRPLRVVVVDRQGEQRMELTGKAGEEPPSQPAGE